eukprot:c41154_g1_i1 orf=3-158(-)
MFYYPYSMFLLHELSNAILRILAGSITKNWNCLGLQCLQEKSFWMFARLVKV